jgi:hypothetical protein
MYCCLALHLRNSTALCSARLNVEETISVEILVIAVAHPVSLAPLLADLTLEML